MGTFQADKVKEGRDRIIVVKPCPFKLDTDTKLFVDELTATEVKPDNNYQFSLCGGFTRDSLLGMPFNDYDVSTQNIDMHRNVLHRIGLLLFDEDLPLPERMRIRTEEGPQGRLHDYYMSPWDPNRTRRPVHWIESGPEGLVHDRFDFSINEFCLKSDGNLYAPTYSWRDLENQLLRLNARIRPTVNSAFRAVRFMAKYDFKLHPITDTRIKDFVENHHRIANSRSVAVIRKIIQEGTGDKALEVFQRYAFPGSRGLSSIEEFKQYLDRCIEQGNTADDDGHYNGTPF